MGFYEMDVSGLRHWLYLKQSNVGKELIVKVSKIINFMHVRHRSRQTNNYVSLIADLISTGIEDNE